MSSLNKTVIYPKVIVYHNLLNDPKKITDILQENRGKTENNYYLRPWKSWKPMGEIMNIPLNDIFLKTKNKEKNNQQECLLDILNAFTVSSNDFFEMYSKEKGWPDFVTHFDRSNQPWNKNGMSFLRYEPTNYNYDIKNNKQGLAMDYHTDHSSFNEGYPGEKFVITVTIYLNDEYEGGEISFLDESTGSITNYKPKAGDVTVFPSGYPYFHGVLPLLNGERYLLRMFWSWYHEGTKEWHEGYKKYGKEEWTRMQNERKEIEFNSGKHHRVVVYPGEEFDSSLQKSTPFYVKEINDN
jgi:hypothetical protein